MKVLGIDTSTRFLCLGIYDNGRIYEYNLETGRRLSSLLSLTVKRIIEALGWQIKDIDYFACGLGPGSFTGIRIGLSFIKGLGWSLDKPLIGVSTLDTLAKNAPLTESLIVPVIDAKRNLIYSAIYRQRKGALKRESPYMLLTEKELYKKIKPNSLMLGDAISLYKEKILGNVKGAAILDRDYWFPSPHNIIALALEQIRKKKINSPFKIKPIYLYPKECQIRNR